MFISCDWPIPSRFLSAIGGDDRLSGFSLMKTLPGDADCDRHTLTVEAAPAVLVVDVLREAVILQQLVRWVLELGEGLRRAADVGQGRGAFRRAGVGAEGAGEGDWSHTFSFILHPF